MKAVNVSATHLLLQEVEAEGRRDAAAPVFDLVSWYLLGFCQDSDSRQVYSSTSPSPVHAASPPRTGFLPAQALRL